MSELGSSRAASRLRPPHWRRGLAVAAAALGLGAITCGGSSEPSAIGELGNGRFTYVCVGSSDPVCELQGVAPPFPDCIALHGTFRLEYTLLDTSILDGDELTPVIYIDSVSQAYFRGDDAFEAVRTGEAALLVREDENVLDLIHLRIAAADDFDIVANDPAAPTASVQIPRGETAEFRVFPRVFSCPTVGGAIPIVAESNDPSVVSVSDGDVLRVQGQALGTATVRVRLGELEKTMTVEVIDGPVTPPDTTTGPGEGSSSDGGTEGTGTDGSDSSGSGSGSDGSSGGSDSGSSGSTGGAT